MTYTVTPLAATAQGGQHQQQPTPPSNKKTIYLIRHGEGFHNIGYDHNLDAHLTPRGWAQTAALQQHLTALQPHLGIQLVVVSPLRRTLETAAGVFGAAAPPATAPAAAAAAAAAPVIQAMHETSADSSADSHPAWVLMKQQTGRPNEVTPQAVMYLPPIRRRAVMAAAGAAAAGAVMDAAAGRAPGAAVDGAQDDPEAGHMPLKLLAKEECRERIGPNVCDKFRDLQLQTADFPGVDFSLMEHSTDVVWEELHAAPCMDGRCYRIGEEESACEARAMNFYAWLLSRPESVIAVVSHCGFLFHGMHALSKHMLHTWKEAMTVEYKARAPCAAPTPLTGPTPDPQTTTTSSLRQLTISSTNSPTAAGMPVAQNPSSLPGLNPGSVPGLNPTNSPLPSQPVPVHYSPGGISFGPRLGPPSPGPLATPAAQTAEALRAAATDLSRRMAFDWCNCECRSIELRWGHSNQLLSGPAAALAAAEEGAAGAGPADDVFLWAEPGDPLTWWPGGLYGLQEGLLS